MTIRADISPDGIRISVSNRRMRFRGPYALAAAFLGAEIVEPTTKAYHPEQALLWPFPVLP